MPETLHPGVYVEEVPTLPRAIEGVPTGVAAFLGTAGRGPALPRLVASLAEAQRIYGARDVAGSFLLAALRGFFANGGRQAWVARVGGPDVSDYEGRLRGARGSGLAALAAIDGIALVAAPGAPGAVQAALVRHCEARRDRIAILDGPRAPWTAASIEAELAAHGLRSARAAYYVPWLAVAGSRAGETALVPPSGAACGIIARVDAQRGVWKAPANEVVTGALGLELEIDDRLQDVLNPRGINGIRAFAGRGILLWGARTLAQESEMRYLNVCRLLIYLEQSIVSGLQWAVFEPNDAPLWTQARACVANFLNLLWRQGALAGIKPEQAYFVRADRATMTQADIDTGRLVIEIGVAPLKPAEFVIVRIGVWTASR